MIAKPVKMSEQEIKEYKRILEIYDYYGIPHGIFDEKEIPKYIERDWSKAIDLLSSGKELPKDLAERLLSYKNKLNISKK